MPLLETLGHSQASLGQSLVSSLLLSPGSWYTQGFVCAVQESCVSSGEVPQSCVSSGGSVLATSSKRTYAIPRSAAPRTLPLWQATAALYLCRRHKHSSGSVSVGTLGPGVHKILSMPSKSLFPQSCVSSGGSMVELIATSCKRAFAIPRSAAPRAPAPAAGHC